MRPRAGGLCLRPSGAGGGGAGAVQPCASFWTGSTAAELGGRREARPQECGRAGCGSGGVEGWRGGRTGCETFDPNPARGASPSGRVRGAAGEGRERRHPHPPRRASLGRGDPRGRAALQFPVTAERAARSRVYYSAPAHAFLLVRVRRAPLPRPLSCPLLERISSGERRLRDRRARVEIPKFPQTQGLGDALTANRRSLYTLANLGERKKEKAEDIFAYECELWSRHS